MDTLLKSLVDCCHPPWSLPVVLYPCSVQGLQSAGVQDEGMNTKSRENQPKKKKTKNSTTEISQSCSQDLSDGEGGGGVSCICAAKEQASFTRYTVHKNSWKNCYVCRHHIIYILYEKLTTVGLPVLSFRS